MKKPVIDENLTQQVANLARLELTPGEVTKFTKQLGDIVGYIDQLQALDVKGILPLTHPLVDHTSELREDEVVDFPKDSQGHSKTLAPAPDSVVEDGGGSFKVPQVI
jgi:aspartyl-tRNA(Asn)/glutamyl-tRNA(Gln) amidotransferase subunit C